MAQYRKDMEEETRNAIANELHSQTKQTFDKLVETDWRLTQHNFLINAGGSAAVLAYLGRIFPRVSDEFLALTS